MKKHLLIYTVISVLFALAGCDDDRTKMTSDYPSDYDLHYGLFHVYQYDEVNINGIDIADKFPFFSTFRLDIHYLNSKISAVTVSNGDIPFSPYDFEIPTGTVDCYLDTESLPNAIRLTGTDQVIAYYVDGEFSIPFSLDCRSVEYKYTFKSVNQ